MLTPTGGITDGGWRRSTRTVATYRLSNVPPDTGSVTAARLVRNIYIYIYIYIYELGSYVSSIILKIHIFFSFCLMSAVDLITDK